MKLFVTLLFCACIALAAGASSFANVWIDGPQAPSGAGSATYPSARQKAASWTDSAGNFWLYGGTDNSATTFYNDLWTYNSTGQVWKSVSTGDNPNYPAQPGGTGYPDKRASAVTWKDAQGNFYLFGGVANLGKYSDFWRFNPSTSVWTLLSGGYLLDQKGDYASVGYNGYPSARMGAVGWADAQGNFWLFGGEHNATTVLNDLWRVLPTNAQEWNWVAGEQTGGTQQGGTTGQPGYPGPTAFAGAWTNSAKNLFYLYGGLASTTVFWRYDVSLSTFTSLGSTASTDYTAGTVPPLSRHGFNVFVEDANSVNIFGGKYGSNSANAVDNVWNYNMGINTWSLQAGKNVPNFAGVFQIISPPQAEISARAYAASYTDARGQFWIFGGSNGNNAPLSDLWKLSSVDVCADTICDSAAACGNNRYICTCNPGYIGNGFKCCDDAQTCNNNGVCNTTTFGCNCDAKYNVTAGPGCTVCVNNLFGANCDTPCSPATNCSGHGTCALVNSTIQCVCAFNYKGPKCDQCADGYYGQNCSTFCNASTTCFGLGTCNTTTGQCICDGNQNGTDCRGCAVNYYGADCTRFCNASTTCFGRGRCDPSNGLCLCTDHYDGVRCQMCAPNFFGPNCTQYCDALGYCNGRGTCNINGSCNCAGNFSGTTCSECGPNYFGDNCDFYCGNDTCNNHGQCVYPGVCSCSGNFQGNFCTNCTQDNYGTNCSIYCDALTSCEGHGACNSTGGCTCNTGYAGDRCDTCAPCYKGDSCQEYCPTGQSCNSAGLCQVSAGSQTHISHFVAIVAVVSCLLLLSQ